MRHFEKRDSGLVEERETWQAGTVVMPRVVCGGRERGRFSALRTDHYLHPSQGFLFYPSCDLCPVWSCLDLCGSVFHSFCCFLRHTTWLLDQHPSLCCSSSLQVARLISAVDSGAHAGAVAHTCLGRTSLLQRHSLCGGDVSWGGPAFCPPGSCAFAECWKNPGDSHD